jgi:PAS domain S-box-containing protein
MKTLRSISLKWKLLIPFLFFAFTGTATFTYVGLTSQQKLIKEEEKKEILHLYHLFFEELNHKANQALSLATMLAENPEVQALLAEKRRQALTDLLVFMYVRMKKDFNIEQFHFHIPPANSFLRLHHPEHFGEETGAYRKTITEAIKTGKAVSGLEKGATGLGVRGVVPVFYEGSIVGAVEIGHSFGEAFLLELHKEWGSDLALYEIKGKDTYTLVAKAGKRFEAFFSGQHLATVTTEKPAVLVAPRNDLDRSILLGPVKDYSGQVVALVEIDVDRSATRKRLTQTRNLMVSMGIVAVAVSFLLTFLVAFHFTKPIKEIVGEAQDIAQGKRESRLESRPNDEIGALTVALNIMLDSLKKRRMEIEEHARTLERRVQERTSDLVASEEKYRTLVENVPLIVYRVLQDGTTEFVNSYLTESLGYTTEEAVRDKKFWREKICEKDLSVHKDIFKICFQKGEECRVERSVRHKNGRLLTFIDHAIPTRDETGGVKWIDGIMIDISQLKRLQERALRGEEVRLLGEISARMAHEVRNPLATAGGFARRLRDSLPEQDSNRQMAQIIVEEVARIEDFLKILLSSIRPFDLSLTSVDLNELLRSWIMKLDGRLKSKRVKVVEQLSPDLPKIQADDDRLNQVFENLLKHAIVSMPEGETLTLSTGQMDDHLVVTLRHKFYRLSDDDLEQFFFPHIEDETEWTILDLPLSKIIIHRHGGNVDLIRDRDDILVMKIEFPMRLA